MVRPIDMLRSEDVPKMRRKSLVNGWRLNVARIRIRWQPGLRVKIYEALLATQEDGLTLQEGMDNIWLAEGDQGRRARRPIPITMAHWRRMYDDHGLSRAVRGWIPTDEVRTIQAGEQASMLVALRDMLDIIAFRKRIWGAMSGLLFPAVFGGMAEGLVQFYGGVLIPQLLSSTVNFSGITVTWMEVTMTIFESLSTIALVGALAVSLVVASFSRLTGESRWYLDKVFPWSIYRVLTGTSLMLNASALLNAQKPLDAQLEILLQGASPYLRERLLAARRQMLTHGSTTIVEVFYRSGYDFPDRALLSTLITYASVRGFPEALARVSRRWTDESLKRIKAGFTILAVILGSLVFSYVALTVAGLGYMAMQATQN